MRIGGAPFAPFVARLTNCETGLRRSSLRYLAVFASPGSGVRGGRLFGWSVSVSRRLVDSATFVG